MSIVDGGEARASYLAKNALELVAAGKIEAGARAVREAVSIDPDNADVKRAFDELQNDQNRDPLWILCRRFVNDRDDSAGREAIHFLARYGASVPRSIGEECVKLLLDRSKVTYTPLVDELVAALLRQNVGARAEVAYQLETKIIGIFEDLWMIGDQATDALSAVLLDPQAWTSHTSRIRCEGDVFHLLEAKLIEAGQDHPSRAMRVVARLLAADAENVKGRVDEDTFDVMLTSLDNRLPADLRTQATLAAAKFIEASPDDGQRHLNKFVLSRLAKQKNDDLIVAFSAAAAVFPVASAVCIGLFLNEGFVSSLVPVLNKKAKSRKAERAALDLLSAACIDRACRELIAKHCTEWLEDVVEDGAVQESAVAAVILAKIRGPGALDQPAQKEEPKVQEVGKETAELVDMFKKMIVTEDTSTTQSSIEGLAYSSLQPATKEELANDKAFLTHLVRTMSEHPDDPNLIFGGLTIFANLTRFLPNFSEEQKRMSQLKAYANVSKPKLEPDPLDSEDKVTARCKAVLDANTVPLLVAISKKVSPASLQLTLFILLSISKGPKHRGQLAQQGAVRLLLQAYASITGDTTADIQSRRVAAHALARVLISVNPFLIFPSSGALSASSAVRPLLLLLEDDHSAEQRDLLPVFESLLALTNLASTDDSTRESLLRLGWPAIENLLLADNTFIQRAAVELVCNLMASPAGVAHFADGSPAASNRLHILLALADVDDFATRRAAGGALAMLTEWDAAVTAVLKRERGVRILLSLCEEESDELVHRGVVCIRNLVCAPHPAGDLGTEKVRAEGGVEVLKQVLATANNPDILEPLVEALKGLVAGGSRM
ncbi:putative actin cytoskeleton organization protein [Xylona heveae TC161]|uniref:Putative actin cytoskeleton organization protein n=1 Tax=Xylona heveae (strain CBS 132557 / TC161) TaxID=1328760 RepID=A0A164ZSV5_XYLHT|nr:putative actin cytoskeleton organization protein [Xylona heveae TC161]KZF19466.1 putative actin cytoskeleton organization protein [Xylona heveae TC161]